MRWPMVSPVALALRAEGLVIGPSGFKIPLSETPCEQKWNLTFENCCTFRPELRHLPRLLTGKLLLSGHARLCWRKPYEECCLVNTQAPITTLPKWSLGIVLLKVRDPTGRDHFLKVVQGSALRWWQETLEQYTFASAVLKRIPHFAQNLHEAGLLWRDGLSLAAAVAELVTGEGDARPSFLEVAAGTGLASLVAMLRGWKVLSTDLYANSGLQRLQAARASFGENSTALGRLRVSELDLQDPRTWPSNSFDVIACARVGSKSPFLSSQPVFGGVDVRELTLRQECLLFRKLTARNLAKDGLGFFAFSNVYDWEDWSLCVDDAGEMVGELWQMLPSGSWQRASRPEVGARQLSFVYAVQKRR